MRQLRVIQGSALGMIKSCEIVFNIYSPCFWSEIVSNNSFWFSFQFCIAYSSRGSEAQFLMITYSIVQYIFMLCEFNCFLYEELSHFCLEISFAFATMKFCEISKLVTRFELFQVHWTAHQIVEMGPCNLWHLWFLHHWPCLLKCYTISCISGSAEPKYKGPSPWLFSPPWKESNLKWYLGLCMKGVTYYFFNALDMHCNLNLPSVLWASMTLWEVV